MSSIDPLHHEEIVEFNKVPSEIVGSPSTAPILWSQSQVDNAHVVNIYIYIKLFIVLMMIMVCYYCHSSFVFFWSLLEGILSD